MRGVSRFRVGRSSGGPRGTRWLVIIATTVAALGLAVPPAAASSAAIKVAPGSIDFGTKAVGATYFDDVKITNASGKPLQFLVEGGLPDDFGFGLYPGSTCPALTPGAMLAPRESCRAVVRFTPSEFFVGWEQTGSLIVTATDPVTGAVTSLLIPVSGRGK
jgi:hypothetical protein